MTEVAVTELLALISGINLLALLAIAWKGGQMMGRVMTVLEHLTGTDARIESAGEAAFSKLDKSVDRLWSFSRRNERRVSVLEAMFSITVPEPDPDE